jgi:hypothetical protein
VFVVIKCESIYLLSSVHLRHKIMLSLLLRSVLLVSCFALSH